MLISSGGDPGMLVSNGLSNRLKVTMTTKSGPAVVRLSPGRGGWRWSGWRWLMAFR